MQPRSAFPGSAPFSRSCSYLLQSSTFVGVPKAVAKQGPSCNILSVSDFRTLKHDDLPPLALSWIGELYCDFATRKGSDSLQGRGF
jgi:hypothetical protein